MAGYHVENFGCRASQADGDAIAASFEQFGSHAASIEQAEIVVVNTCSVTAAADRDARAYIRRVGRSNPEARIVVTGCYAQRAPNEVAALPGVSAVVGNSHKDQVAAVAMKLNELREAHSNGFVPLAELQTSASSRASETALCRSGDAFAHTEFHMPASFMALAAVNGAQGRTRPTLKIQDGCGNRCTFCIIPQTRGDSRSLPRRLVLDAVEQFVARGGHELVLSGINLGRWGRDLTPKDCLEDLLETILATTRLPRLRVSSIEPMDWSDGLIALFARWGEGEHPRMARHVHLPLQSGSDAVLRRMHRRYRPWHYAEKVGSIRDALPDAAIGADVMAGFPGETDAEFGENYDFIAGLPLTYLHLFPFSARPGTPAWATHRERPAPASAVKERMAALRGLIGGKNRAFRESFAGRELSAITLIPDADATSDGRSSALTDNFLTVELAGVWAANTMLSVRVIGLGANGVRAEAVGLGDPAELATAV